MPLVPSFITNRHLILGSCRSRLLPFITGIALQLVLCSCGIVTWHTVEQTPADSVAYLRDSVFVSGDYVRGALITEIDGKVINKSSNDLIKISLGSHRVKINCSEAEGEFNSKELSGKAKTLELKAQMQRSYVVQCIPYTHWWIEDLDNNKVVAGEKFEQ